VPRKRSWIRNWAEYLAAGSVTGTLGCLPVDLNVELADFIADLIYRINRGRRSRITDNIRRCFPDWSEAQLERVAQASMRHMCRMFMVESMRLARMISQETWTKHLKIGPVERLMNLMVRGGPVVSLTGHCGNWELVGMAMASIGYPLTVVARPLDNPLLNDWILRTRQVRGTRIVTKWGGTNVLQDVLRNGGRVGFVADQNAGDDGMFVPFFSRMASAYKAIGLLAMRYHAPIIVGVARRTGPNIEYELQSVDVIMPGDWADQPDPLFYITARYNLALETAVRSAPDQYLWMHRRWKSRPPWERAGKPMPARVINQLENLPWMTQPQLDAIVRTSNDEAAARAAAHA